MYIDYVPIFSPGHFVTYLLFFRLAQSEVPHESLCHSDTIQTLVRYLCWTRKPSKRAGRILLRLSKNLYCLMPIVNQRIMSWLKPEIASRPTMKDPPCQECQDLEDLSKELSQNFSLLAETGYAEGVMCHKLVKGEIDDKRNVSVSATLLVRPRKLLLNILINHEGLDVLLDIIEKFPGENESRIFADATYSLSNLSGHLGIVAPNLTIEESTLSCVCRFEENKDPKNLKIKTDDGKFIEVNRDKLCNASSVFEAMLSGQFAESSQNEIQLPMTGFSAIVCLIHHLYGCQWCPVISNMSVQVLLELTSLTDKYLLVDFNRVVSAEIVRRCQKPDQVVQIYEASLQNEYPVGGTKDNLNVCATSYLLVGDVEPEVRAEVFRQLMKSNMASDFLDDVNRIVREKLMQPI